MAMFTLRINAGTRNELPKVRSNDKDYNNFRNYSHLSNFSILIPHTAKNSNHDHEKPWPWQTLTNLRQFHGFLDHILGVVKLPLNETTFFCTFLINFPSSDTKNTLFSHKKYILIFHNLQHKSDFRCKHKKSFFHTSDSIGFYTPKKYWKKIHCFIHPVRDEKLISQRKI